MPQNQRQLRNLFPLLAKLEERRLSRVGIEHLSDPVQDLAVVLAHLLIRAHHAASAVVEVSAATERLVHVAVIVIRVSVLRYAPVVLLLSGGIRGRSSLGLRILVVGLRVRVMLPIRLI